MLNKFTPSVSSCEPLQLKTSLATLTMYRVPSSDLQNATTVVNGTESSRGNCTASQRNFTTSTAATTTAAAAEDDAETGNSGGTLGISAKFLSSAGTGGSIGVTVSENKW